MVALPAEPDDARRSLLDLAVAAGIGTFDWDPGVRDSTGRPPTHGLSTADVEDRD
jgi:hypothetical protein